MPKDIDFLPEILSKLPQYIELARKNREIVLANAVMLGEEPAPTFKEDARTRFLADRFTEAGLQNISVDEKLNASAILPGKKGDKTILISAHADTPFDSTVDHTISVASDTLSGPGIADNSLGLSVIASLPKLLEEANLELDCNLLLLGSTRSLGQGDLEGLTFFMDNVEQSIDAGLIVEGLHLGRLSYSCLGLLRGEITCQVPEEGDWQKAGASLAITTMSRIVSKIMAIPIPQSPKTSIILGSLKAGKGYTTAPTEATLKFEVRSEQVGMIGELLDNIEDIVEEANAEHDVEAGLNIVARRAPGGINFHHPLVKSARVIMDELDIKSNIAPTVGDLTAVMGKDIPGLTIGLTKGTRKSQVGESIFIEPIFSGIAQLIAVIESLDKGACDEKDR